MPEPQAPPIRVLFVDDNADDRLLAQVAIRREYPKLIPLDVFDASGFAAALEQGAFDVVVTDYELRWSNGLDVLHAVKRAWPDRPVLMYTGSGSEEVAVEAMRGGLDDYVIKGPRRVAKLPVAIRSALERAREREVLAEAQARYRDLFETVPVGLMRADRDGALLDANIALAEILGASDRHSLVGRPWRDAWADDREWQRWRTKLERAGVVRGLDGRLVRVDGEIRHVLLDTRVVADADGRVCAYEGSVVDVTERRQAEDHLRASEARKGAMLEASLDAVIAIDQSGRITSFNPGAERTFGHRRDQVEGRELADVLVPADLRERHRAGLARYLATGETTILGQRIEMRALRADGQEIPVELAIDRIDLPGPPEFIGYVRDISEQRRLEESARRRQQIEAIGQLAGGVAHDFNNMLTVIDGFSAILLEELTNADHRTFVDGIQEASSRAKALTRQLLAFSRRQVLRPQPVDLGLLVTGLRELIRRAVPEDIAIRIRVSPDEAVTEVGPVQLEQVLLNLVVNARDAMPSGGEIRIETGVADLEDGNGSSPEALPSRRRYAVVAVSDTGVGMDQETLAHIFEPFFTTKEVGKGTGLGLAMAYGTVTQSGGTIAVESAVGRGTTFRIHLPLTDLPVERPTIAPAERSRRLPPGTSVLVVEDEDQVRDLMVRALIDAGCTIFTAANGTEALSAVDSTVPLDVVVTDVVMPGLNGPEVVRLLRESRPEVKVLYISGYAPQFATSRGVALGADPALLQKPFTLAELVTKVREVLGAP